LATAVPRPEAATRVLDDGYVDALRAAYSERSDKNPVAYW
jgi:hypothetical protein